MRTLTRVSPAHVPYRPIQGHHESEAEHVDHPSAVGESLGVMLLVTSLLRSLGRGCGWRVTQVLGDVFESSEDVGLGQVSWERVNCES